MKVVCEGCGGLRSERAAMCRQCRLRRYAETRQRWHCRSCGTELDDRYTKRCAPCAMKHRYPFPRERVAAVVSAWANRWNELHADEGSTSQGPALDTLAEMSGVSRRGIYRILNGLPPSDRGSGDSLKFDTVDRLFCAMHCVWLFQVPPEQGGFADIYHSLPFDDEDELAEAA